MQQEASGITFELHFLQFWKIERKQLKHSRFHDKVKLPSPVQLFWKKPLFFRYSGVNAANAANFLAKRR